MYLSVVVVGFVWANGVPQLKTRLIGMVHCGLYSMGMMVHKYISSELQ